MILKLKYLKKPSSSEHIKYISKEPRHGSNKNCNKIAGLFIFVYTAARPIWGSSQNTLKMHTKNTQQIEKIKEYKMTLEYYISTGQAAAPCINSKHEVDTWDKTFLQ